jgi:alpha-methylacyl-CoA racemase
MIYGFKAAGRWRDERESNLLDGGTPFYGTYRCADGKFVAVGSLEPQFYQALIEGLGLDSAGLPDRWDQRAWPDLRARLETAFASRPRDAWADVFAATDACVTPILAMDEAPLHPHNAARSTFVAGESGAQPAPAPRFSRTPGEIASPPAAPGADGEAILREHGFSPERIEGLRREGAM